MHSEHAEAEPADPQGRRHHPARFKAGYVDDVVAFYCDPVPHQNRVAVPTHRIVLHIQRHGGVICVAFDQKARQHRCAGAEAQIGFLQTHNIGVDFSQYLEDAGRITLAVGADPLVDVVAGEFDPLRHHPAASRLALPPAAVVSMVITRSVAKRAR